MITRPQRAPVAAGRRSVLIPMVPLVVLVVGLVLVAIVVGSEPELTADRLRDMFGPLYEPRTTGTSDPIFKFPPISPFRSELDHRAWWLTLLLSGVYLSAATALGSRVVAAVRGEDAWPRPVALMAGFLPGYVMLLAPLQLLYGAVPYRTASWIAVVAVASAALAVHRRGVIAAVRDVRPRRRAWSGATVGVVVALGLVVVAAVHRLQQGVFFLTQDSITYYLLGADNQMAGINPSGHYLAHWNTQTDEWLFNAPLMFAGGQQGNIWFSFYLTQCVSLVSLLCLVYGIVHRVARRRKGLAAGMAVVTTFGSTMAIYPWLYVTIVGGGQPLLALGHPGRQVSIVAPWVALIIMQRPRKAGYAAIALLTLGLAFITISALLYVGVIVAAVFFWRALPRRAGVLAPAASRGLVHACLVLALGLPIVAFARTGTAPTAPIVPGLILVGAIVAALVGALMVSCGTTARTSIESGRRWLRWGSAWVATVVVGIAFSDSLLSEHTGRQIHRVLGALLPGFERPSIIRKELPDGLLVGMSFPEFSQTACDANVSCGGVGSFLLAYGVLFTLVLATWVSYGRLCADAAATNERRALMLLALSTVVTGLILVFFTGVTDPVQAGVLTRLLEWPYYSLLVLAVLGFCEATHRRVAFVGAGFLLVWTIVPLIGTGWPVQMVRNAKFYLNQFGML